MEDTRIEYELTEAPVVPEEKKDELNRYVLTVLERCGTRKIKNKTIDGKTFSVVSLPEADKNGIVEVDYSIFDHRKQKPARYNLDTCCLEYHSNDGNEFGISLLLVMVLLEAFSENDCYLLWNGRPCSIRCWLSLLMGVLGTKIEIPKRNRAWHFFQYFKSKGIDLTASELWEAIWGANEQLSREFRLVFSLYNDKISAPEEVVEGKREDVKNHSWLGVRYYAFRLIQELIQKDDMQVVRDYVINLSAASLEEREKMALREDDFGTLAECSRYLFPQELVRCYANAAGTGFWDLWDGIGDAACMQCLRSKIVIDEKEASSKEEVITPVSFFEGIGENRDEFLEFDGLSDVSKGMSSCLAAWNNRFKNHIVLERFDMKQCLARILYALDTYSCRYADIRFVTEFLEHADDAVYQKAASLYEEELFKDARHLPELTERQVMEWITGPSIGKTERVQYGAFQSVLINRENRQAVFGF